LLTLGGIVLIVAPWAERAPDERFWFGVGTATLASLAWAVSVIFLKAPLRELDAVTAQAIRLPLAAVVLWTTPWARAAAGGLGRIGGSALARLAALSVLTAVSSVMFVASVKYAGVAVSAVLSSTAPMFAIPLAQAERFRRHLEELVLADPLEALLEVHAAGRGQLGRVVRGGRAHVGELLLLGNVDVHVVVTRVLADDLALIHLEAGPDEHGPPRLEVVDRVRGRPPGAVGDERAVLPVGDLALPVVPPVEQMV